MWIYIFVFLAAIIADSIPVIAPSAWMVMVFLILKFNLPLWPVLFAGVSGSTFARYLHRRYLPKIAANFLKRAKHRELELLGEKLMQRGPYRWAFIFFYTITPLPDTVLVTAAGMTKMRPLGFLVPYFCGKFIGCAVIILSIQTTINDIRALRHGAVSSIAILTGLTGFAVLFALLFIDWRALIERNKFQFRFRIWK